MTTDQQIKEIKELWSSTMTTDDLIESLLEAYTENKASYIDELHHDLLGSNTND